MKFKITRILTYTLRQEFEVEADSFESPELTPNGLLQRMVIGGALTGTPMPPAGLRLDRSATTRSTTITQV